MSEFEKQGFIPEELGKNKVEIIPEKIDKELYDEYMRFYPGEDYEYLVGDENFRANQFEKIKAGDANIELDYIKLNDFDELDKKEIGLIELKKKIRIVGRETRYIEQKISEKDKDVEKEVILKNAYRWKINEDLAAIRMLRNTFLGRKAQKEINKITDNPEEAIEDRKKKLIRRIDYYDEQSKAELEKRQNDTRELDELIENPNEAIEKRKRELIKRIEKCDKRFSRYSDFIYGEPQKELFDYFRLKIIDKCDLICGNSDYPDEIKQIAKELISILSKDINTLDKEKILSNVPKIETTKMEQDGRVIVSPEEFKNILEFALEKINAHTEWQVIIDDNKTGLSVNQKEKTVSVPNKPREELENKIKSLIMHEVGTHVQRRINGERSKMALLGPGYDRYVRGEEAAATYNEQKILGFDEFAGIDGILAIGLVKGIDSSKKNSEKSEEDYRNCVELYNILVKFFTINKFLETKNFEKAKSNAHVSAKNRCIRTFRGINNLQNKKGECFERDVVYSDNMKLWRIIKNDGFDEEKIFLGKFDPNNERHNFILSVLGISDDELEKELK